MDSNDKQVGEVSYHPAQRQADIEGRIEPSARELEGLHDEQVGGVQGDADRLWPELDRLLVDAYNAGVQGDEFDVLAARKTLIADTAARQPGAQVPTNWYPIEQAPKDNKRPLFIAQFDSEGKLIEMDWDAIWEAESESWELPQVYYVWMSANGRVEEPTHFAYMDAPAQGIDLGQLQRYDLDEGFDHYRSLPKDKGAHLYEDATGDWVKWDDVLALIDQRDAAPGVSGE